LIGAIESHIGLLTAAAPIAAMLRKEET
jgi:hypothetical protein